MALAGERNCGPLKTEPISRRAPLPTTDALFAHEVEQKVSNLLEGLQRRSEPNIGEPSGHGLLRMLSV
jgi:hypothetical protein